MYQDSQVTDPLVFSPDAKIVIANRECELNDGNYDKPIQMNAEDISNKLRTGYLYNKNYEQRTKQISSVISAVKEAAGETDSEELIEFLHDLANILNITLTKTYKVSLTFSVDAEIELPLGSDESDVDADDFTVMLEYNNYDGELTDWDTTDVRLDDCDTSY